MCKHAVEKVIQINQLGDSALYQRIFECLLKKSSQQAQLEVFEELSRRQLEGNMLTDECPVASTDQWTQCPFYG